MLRASSNQNSELKFQNLIYHLYVNANSKLIARSFRTGHGIYFFLFSTKYFKFIFDIINGIIDEFFPILNSILDTIRIKQW